MVRLVRIVHYVFTTFILFIINIQFIIQFNSVDGILILAFMWTVKNTFLLTLTSMACEDMHISLKNVQVACIMALHNGSNPEFLHEASKQLHQMGCQKFQPLNALGLFTVNAALLPNMLSALATYTVILLQLNFL
ncbi:unnamed protein product, partial [Iphiclides podalirius]